MSTRYGNRKAEVLESIVDYVFENGVSDLSLRPLADSLGTSSRMLVYHFGTKERMLAEVIAAARIRQYEMLGEWTEEGATLPELIRRYWAWAASEVARPYMRLFFEVFGLAVQGRPGTDEVLPSVSAQAVDFFTKAALRTGVRPGAVDELVRLALATMRGLLFDLLATNDRPPLDAGLERFLTFLASQLGPPEE